MIIISIFLNKQSSFGLYFRVAFRSCSYSFPKILPLYKLINQQEGILAYKVINGTYLLKDFLNHGDVRHKIQLRNIGDLTFSTLCSLQSHQYVEWNIRGLAQLIIALYFQDKLRQLYLSLTQFPNIRIVSMVIKLLSSSTEVTMQYSSLARCVVNQHIMH